MAAALVLVAMPGDARDRDVLADRTAGAAEECLSLDRVQGPEVVDADTILYRQNRSRIWITHPVDACPGLRPQLSTLIIRVDGSQICRNDPFRVRSIDSPMPGPVCRFGRFVPYDLPKRR